MCEMAAPSINARGDIHDGFGGMRQRGAVAGRAALPRTAALGLLSYPKLNDLRLGGGGAGACRSNHRIPGPGTQIQNARLLSHNSARLRLGVVGGSAEGLTSFLQ